MTHTQQKPMNTNLREKIKNKIADTFSDSIYLEKQKGKWRLSSEGYNFDFEEEMHQISDQILTLISEEIEKMKKRTELEPPQLMQHNPTRNSMGGYSSVPFCCTLCGMSELDIQDNTTENGECHCRCSVWSDSLAGKWIRWHDIEVAQTLASEIPCEENIYNNALSDILSLLNKLEKEEE